MFAHVSQKTRDIVRAFDPQFVHLCNCELSDQHAREQAQEQLDTACTTLEGHGIRISDVFTLVKQVAPGFQFKDARLVFYQNGQHRPCASLKYLLMMVDPYFIHTGMELA